MAALRQSTAAPLDAESIRPEIKARVERDCQLLGDCEARWILQVESGCITLTGNPRKNIGNVIYDAFDAGWRADYGTDTLNAPDGTTRKPPAKWRLVFLAIQRAAELAKTA